MVLPWLHLLRNGARLQAQVLQTYASLGRGQAWRLGRHCQLLFSAIALSYDRHALSWMVLYLTLPCWNSNSTCVQAVGCAGWISDLACST